MVDTDTGSAGVRIIKTRQFAKWSKTEHISDIALAKAIAEIENGLIDADLGGGLIKNGSLSMHGEKVVGLEPSLHINMGSERSFYMDMQKTKKVI